MYKNFDKRYIEKVRELNLSRNLKYTIYTMGCQMNENDSERYSGMLEGMGYTKTDSINDANFILFNTCCIRENAEKTVFGKLGETKILKKENELVLCFAGCMSQQAHIVQTIEKKYRFVDIIIGTHNSHLLPEKLYEVLSKKVKVREILEIDGDIVEDSPIKRESCFKASVSIMYGCNNFCSYCIVPYVRGRERSRKIEEVIREVSNLSLEGYKEVTLLGQNVNSYSNDIIEDSERYGKVNFANLLNEVSKIEGIECVRFMSPHPKDFTDDVIKSIKNNSNVSRNIHLPLQSGSTAILKAMNRKYTKDQYIQLAEKIRNNVPDVAFSTDIIVGFPGENNEDFKDTLDVIKQIGFDQIYMFIYSRRKGTKADEMEDQIEEDVKVERLQTIKKLHEEMLSEINERYVGKTYKVLVEGESKNNKELLTGRNSQNKVIIFKGEKANIGEMVNVKIRENHKWYLMGDIEI